MTVLHRYRALSAAVAVLSLALVSLSLSQQTAAILGYQVRSLGTWIEVTSILLIIIAVVFVILVAWTTALGYFVLTGWCRYRQIPLGIRLLAGLLIGTAITFVSAPVGLLIPIPLVPSVIAAVVAWYLLRRLLAPNSVERQPDISQVERTAIQHLRSEGELDPIRTLDLHLENNAWDGLFLAGRQGTPYRMRINADDARVLSTERIRN